MRKRLRENYEDFVIKNGVLKEYRGMGTDVVVPDDVVAIGAFAFIRTGVQRVTMPSVKDIDDLAFFAVFSDTAALSFFCVSSAPVTFSSCSLHFACLVAVCSSCAF